MNVDIKKLSQVLEEFKQMPKSPLRRPTFLEISGYPHRENVYSNIFRFFFDSEECHGLDNLFLISLLSLLDKDCDEQTSSVETEISTAERKRIDIVIETSSYLIGIENKVFHSIDNPFKSYANYLDKYSGNNGKIEALKVILCLDDSEIKGMPQGRLYGFMPITYGQLFCEIRENIGDCLIQADPKYLSMLFDFMETIGNIWKGSNMNKAFLELLQNEGESIQTILREVGQYQKELKRKVKELAQNIKIDNNSVDQYDVIADYDSLTHILVYDITLPSEKMFTIDACLNSKGWRLDYWYRKGGSLNEVGPTLKPLKIETTEHPLPDESSRKVSDTKLFDYEEDMQGVLPEYINKIINHVLRAYN